MRYTIFISILALSAAMSFAGETAIPESSVPTPAESLETSVSSPDLGAKESADWQKMRAERKAAREQILSKLKESSSVEKKSIRQTVSNNRNENSRIGEKSYKSQSRERQPFYERPDSHNMNLMRDLPGPAPEERDRMYR